MRLDEIDKSKNKIKVDTPKPRNYVAKNAKQTGAGAHNDDKYSRKEKHKKKENPD